MRKFVHTSRRASGTVRGTPEQSDADSGATSGIAARVGKLQGLVGNRGVARLLDAQPAVGRPAVQRARLEFEAPKREGRSASEYYFTVVEPWLADVETRHPEAAGEVEDFRTDFDAGSIDINSWDDLEPRLLMINAKIGEENPHVAGETAEVVDMAAGWTNASGDLTTLQGSAQKNALDDLDTLIRECSGNLHSSSIGTVVGGDKIKGNAKKVKGLNDGSSRIDRQNPPKADVFNVQFQVGSASVAGVLFVQTDPSDVVLAKLRESLTAHQMLKSPRVPAD